MASKNLLTEQDKIAYSAISKFIKENGYSPSVRELCKIMGKSSTATIRYRLKSLEQKGLIKTTSGANRTIRLLNGIEENLVVEVVHAEWTLVIDENDCECIECPLCGEQFYDGDNDTFDKPWNYCPNCGAKMCGGNENG